MGHPGGGIQSPWRLGWCGGGCGEGGELCTPSILQAWAVGALSFPTPSFNPLWPRPSHTVMQAPGGVSAGHGVVAKGSLQPWLSVRLLSPVCAGISLLHSGTIKAGLKAESSTPAASTTGSGTTPPKARPVPAWPGCPLPALILALRTGRKGGGALPREVPNSLQLVSAERGRESWEWLPQVLPS